MLVHESSGPLRMTGGIRSRRSSAVPGTASRHYDNIGESVISPLY
jgi:hypothetical protein